MVTRREWSYTYENALNNYELVACATAPMILQNASRRGNLFFHRSTHWMLITEPPSARPLVQSGSLSRASEGEADRRQDPVANQQGETP